MASTREDAPPPPVRRAVTPVPGRWVPRATPGRGSLVSSAGIFSVEYEHMFAFRPRELPVGLADRVRPTTPVAGRLLPVPVPLAPLFPDGALRRGTTTTVAGLPGHGATTLALALLAAASQAGSWCAAVGLSDPGVVAAAELGIDLRRVVFVPHPGSGWAEAAGDLLPGVDVVLVRPPGRARQTAARHLSAAGPGAPGRTGGAGRARRRLARRGRPGPVGGSGPSGKGSGRGHGHLQGRRAQVRVSGRRSAGRAMECSLWLPAGSGVAVAVAQGEDGPVGPGPGHGPEAA